MRPLTRSRHAQSRSFSAFGVPFAVRVDDPELWSLVLPRLPPELSGGGERRDATTFALRPASGAYWTVEIAGSPWVANVEIDVALTALDQQIRLHVAVEAPGLIFVHAGVVTVGERAIAVPGESFTGKTTLVRALVAAGATYFSDEYAVIDAEGWVLPYRRPLSIRTPDGDRLREEPAPAEDRTPGQGGRPPGRAALGLVAITRFRPGGRWEPEPCGAADGIVTLMANTVPAHDRPREALRALTTAAAGARFLRGDRGEAEPAARALLAALSARGT